MPGGSSVPPGSPPRLPIHPSASWPCHGIRREHTGKTPSISPDQTPTGQQGGGVIHLPLPARGQLGAAQRRSWGERAATIYWQREGSDRGSQSGVDEV